MAHQQGGYFYAALFFYMKKSGLEFSMINLMHQWKRRKGKGVVCVTPIKRSQPPAVNNAVLVTKQKNNKEFFRKVRGMEVKRGLSEGGLREFKFEINWGGSHWGHQILERR